MSGPIRAWLEARQALFYLGAVLVAGILAWRGPPTAWLAPAIEPLLVVMLFVTFLQVPLDELGRALANWRFIGALMTANFIVVPLAVAAVLPWVPADPLLRLGVLLVLLTPCIDYVVAFAQLGRADARALLAATPVLLAAQLLLLPVYLGLMLGDEAAGLIHWSPFVQAFLWLIVLPLGLAAACQIWARQRPSGQRVVTALGLLPVPATAAVLFTVVAAFLPRLGPAWEAVIAVLPIYLGFAVVAPLLGWLVGRAWRLAPDQARAVAFSSATRNSLVVLPLGLAVPGALPWLPAVIVAQTLVELISELVYIRLLPRLGVRRQTGAGVSRSS